MNRANTVRVNKIPPKVFRTQQNTPPKVRTNPLTWSDFAREASKVREWDIAPVDLHARRHTHFFAPNDGDLDTRGYPIGRYVYARCVNTDDWKHCLLRQTRFTAEEYRQMDKLGFIRHFKKPGPARTG
jgi:hypothetical protein